MGMSKKEGTKLPIRRIKKMPLLTNKKDAARRKLLSILPRSVLQTMSRHERPWTLTTPQLLAACIEQWDENAVRDALEKLLMRTTDDRPPLQRRRRTA
jgi:hypothetical protein